jgi:hypothetical protein
MRTLQLGKRLG